MVCVCVTRAVYDAARLASGRNYVLRVRKAAACFVASGCRQRTGCNNTETAWTACFNQRVHRVPPQMVFAPSQVKLPPCPGGELAEPNAAQGSCRQRSARIVVVGLEERWHPTAHLVRGDIANVSGFGSPAACSGNAATAGTDEYRIDCQVPSVRAPGKRKALLLPRVSALLEPKWRRIQRNMSVGCAFGVPLLSARAGPTAAP